MPKVLCDTDGDHIIATFDFDAVLLQKIKAVPGARFVPKEKGGPLWRWTLELKTARLLRQALGSDMVLSDEFRQWGNEAVEREKNLTSLAIADTATLEILPKVLPELYRAIHTGPKGRNLALKDLETIMKEHPNGSFQTADVAYLAHALNPLNGNQPGLGKTMETIASIFESQHDDGPHLVLAPKTSLRSVWQKELEQWQKYPVWVAEGSATDRKWIINDFMGTDGPGWLVCNHHMCQPIRPKHANEKYKHRFPELYELEWATITLDEIHKAGFRDTGSLMFKGMNDLKAQKRIALSGTPVGGKPINLWIIMHWLNPREFSSKWKWAEQWLEITDNGFGKDIGGIRRGLEEEFYKAHAPYFLRRLKSDVLPDLPPKQYVDIWVDMERRQLKQYEEFALAAEVRIEEETLSATGILAEYTRLKQFAIAYNTIEWKVKNGERYFVPIPTDESAKLDALEELLNERGIFDDDGDEQVVIFSQFSRVVDWIYKWLNETKKVKALKLTGDTNKKGQRDEIMQEFQREGKYEGIDGARVICMTTTAGGVSITLDRADTVIFMDETWTPDDQEQAEDRIHRASRNHQVTVYTIRTKKTIEHYIQQRLLGKENVNKMILDMRKAGLKAIEERAA